MYKNCEGYQLYPLENNYYEVASIRNHQEKLDFVELLFNKKINDAFLYKRNNDVRLADYKDIKNGVPLIAPEMILLYKSTFVDYLGDEKYLDMIQDYRHDFKVVLPLLTFSQKEWLKESLNQCYPDGHEWMVKLC